VRGERNRWRQVQSGRRVRRAGRHDQLLDVLLHTMAISGLSRVRTDLVHLLVVPSLAHHPEQTNGESPCHRDLGDLPPSPHRQVKALTAPFGEAACCDLRRSPRQRATQITRTFEKDVLPLLRKQNGFKNEITFAGPGGIDVTAISLWANKADAEAHNTNTYPQVLKTLARFIEGTPKVHTSDVVTSTFQKDTELVTA
jgi:hypothetical protein